MSDEARQNIPTDDETAQAQEHVDTYVDTYLEEKRAWVRYHQERRPIYPPTGEHGTFVGIFGFRTPIGARLFPYYRTPSGISFWESESISRDTGQMCTTVRQLEGESEKRDVAIRFFTAEQWLDG